MRWMRRLLGPAIGRVLIGHGIPPQDYLTEQRAEEGFDSRPVLPRIRVPVLLLGGDRDRFFTRDVVEETARLIPECTLIWYRRQGHLRAGTNKRIAQDVLSFMSAQPSLGS
jgi:pimeloyl-ACP methyl ester carboxylesterase